MSNRTEFTAVAHNPSSRHRPALLALSLACLCALLALLAPAVSQSQVTRSTPKPIPPNEAYMQPVPGLSHGELRKFRN
ncbi:MAG: hypothetical protein EBV69_10970, partial [Oxalobacteraceae bacterium]|nr:hypothetical protein [Oxalobacteraceae bacterium]